MAIKHKLHDAILRPQQAIRILVVGAGGTGSAIMLGLPYLHQAMQVWGHRGLEVTLADGDMVSATNCVRQPFATSDIGLNKAVVLVNRVNLFWGVTWRAYPQHLHKDSLKEQANPHIVVGCVDTRAQREQPSQMEWRHATAVPSIGSTSATTPIADSMCWDSR